MMLTIIWWDSIYTANWRWIVVHAIVCFGKSPNFSEVSFSSCWTICWNFSYAINSRQAIVGTIRARLVINSANATWKRVVLLEKWGYEHLYGACYQYTLSYKDTQISPMSLYHFARNQTTASLWPKYFQLTYSFAWIPVRKYWKSNSVKMVRFPCHGPSQSVELISVDW